MNRDLRAWTSEDCALGYDAMFVTDAVGSRSQVAH
jgi:hypothetical protein